MKRIGLTLGLALLLSFILTSCGKDAGARQGEDPHVQRLQKIIDRQKATIRNLQRQLDESIDSEAGPCFAAIMEGGDAV